MALDIKKIRKSVTEHPHFMLYAPKQYPDGKFPQLLFENQLGNCRILVWTGEAGRTKPIRVGFDSITMNGMMIYLQELGKAVEKLGENFKSSGIDFFKKFVVYESPNYENKLEKPPIKNMVVIGADDDGMIYIIAVEKDRPQIKFYFNISNYHDIYDSTNKLMSKSQKSGFQAASIARTMLNLFMYNFLTPETQEYVNLTGEERKALYGGSEASHTTSSSTTTNLEVPDEDIPF